MWITNSQYYSSLKNKTLAVMMLSLLKIGNIIFSWWPSAILYTNMVGVSFQKEDE